MVTYNYDMQQMLLALLVRDLGYVEQPGRSHPVRHLRAWRMAVEGLKPERLTYLIGAIRADEEAGLDV